MSTPLRLRWAAAAMRHPFQMGYATTSIDQAIDEFARHCDAGDFLVREPTAVTVSGPGGQFTLRLQLAFAYLDEVTVELIQPLVDERGIYSSLLPASGFGLRLHHLGYLLKPDRSSWEAFRRDVADEEILFEGAVDDHTRFAYLDTRAHLGHYQEFLWWDEVRMSWLETVPRN